MDFSALGTSLSNSLGAHLPNILGALAILIVGWVIAVAARAALIRLLAMLKVNQRIQESTDQKMNVESGIAAGVFWVILLVTVLGVLNALDLELVSDPFQVLVTQIFGYLPRLAAGTILVLVAWLVATVLRTLVTRVLEKTAMDEKLSAKAGMEPMSKNVGNVLFWLVILLFIPAILGAYALEGLLAPVQSMINKSLAVLPNVFAAVVIGFVGWLVAKVLRGLVVNLLAAAGADEAGHKAGLEQQVQISRVVGTLVFIFVFIPTLIAALDALQIEAVSRPATNMLSQILDAVPQLVAAGLILVVTWYVAKFASSLVARLLNSVGLDALPGKIGIGDAFSKAPKPSALVGMLIMFFAMLFATVEAANQLQFTQVRDIVTIFISFGGNILLGAVVLLIGFWLASLAYKAITRAGGKGSKSLASVARIAILGLVIAMGLRAMGIADDIVNVAFALTFGAVAVAVALSFGLGGREAAGKQMEHWLSKLRK
ncbi:MAG: mechanosensitive ion channel [Gammaproteobacteria bacterium]|nr:mechanosensitive ion channel [Gammaproteobacteria bacterium]MDH3406798.1 mechanosensitive ion channel [Gammaproteobacteria bacterium]MDH3563837.1 mechanosensitive ion channel [Gammaproteobacteria bacterium]